LNGTTPATVTVGLPGGERATFGVESAGAGCCAVVKDAGDDPDCTNGARLTATVLWREEETLLVAGPGVGTITRPGLGLAVGAPAINPVPRRMILAALAEVTDRPVRVTFSVPGGEAMAAKTSNARLGIVGGISILGTTGIVRPFSTAAYRASVVQQVDVAAAQGHSAMVLATGSRSEQSAFRLFPQLPDVCVVEVGDFTGICLRRMAGAGMGNATFVGMAGKITKLAAGVMMTHFHRSKVDNQLLARVALDTHAPASVVAAATETETARHFFDACLAAACVAPLERLCHLAGAACRSHVHDALAVDVVMVDFEGEAVVARG
jgi:cobalt-precorrin-5B (C1)-methyltransferase